MSDANPFAEYRAVNPANPFAGFAPNAPEPDKYQKAAIEERDALKAKGVDTGAGLTRRAIQGATFNTADEVLAGLSTPFEMVKRGTLDPREAYNYAKAREDLIMEDARKNTGALGTAAELGGGFLTGAGLANAGLTTARALAPNAGILARSGAAAADAGAMGAVAGAAEGNSLAERGANAVKGGGIGLAAGAVTPGILKVAGAIASPVISNVRARLDPAGYARSQVARAMSESSLTPQDIAAQVAQAAKEGQGVYTVADAMGNPGQRMLSATTRAPGPGRTDAVEFLDSRQADQGRRLASSLRDAFDAPLSADQARTAMVDRANLEARFNYQPVKAEQQPINVTNPVALANRSISPVADRLAYYKGVLPTDIAARSAIEKQESGLVDPIRSALKEARSYLANDTLTSSNVSKAFRAKVNIDQMIATATDKKQGAIVAELMPMRDALDESLGRTSQTYAAARDAYRVAQERIGALDLGKTLGAKPIRTEDSITQFAALDPLGREAFRRGYVDPQVSAVQNAAYGTNKARPFSSDAVRAEFNAFATPGKADLLQRQIGREQRMFETRNHATGGSRTADNLADEGALGVDPTLVGHVLTGNWFGAAKSALHAGHNAMTGNTPAVRQEVARLLTMRGGNVSPLQMQDILEQAVNRVEAIRKVTSVLGRGAAGALADVRSASAR